jgi:hypothetical protein
MRLLHEDELSCIGLLLEKQGGIITIKYSDIEYSPDYFGARIIGVHTALGFLEELHKAGLITIKSSKVEWDNFFYDSFLRKYSDLIKNNDIDKAKKLAVSFGFEPLNDALKEQKSLKNTCDIIDRLLKSKKLDMEEGNFAIDLYDAIVLTIEVKEELKKYLEKYLREFKKDNLTKPKSPREEWQKVSYFEREFYRYKKQRQILVDIIKTKLETQSPSKVRVDLKEISAKNLNSYELLECLKREGLIGDCSEKYEGFKVAYWILNVNEEKIVEEPTTKKIKLNLSFSQTTGILILKDQAGTEHKVKIQGQVQKEVLRIFFRFPEQTFSEWSLYDISDLIGQDDSDTKSVKNAIYQINKKIKLKIPEVEKFFDFNIHSARINPKYLS